MKKYKLLPSIIMLIVCFVLLAVGIYSAGPSLALGMAGAIKVTSRGNLVEITVYKDDGVNKKAISAPAKVGDSGRAEIVINQGELDFNKDNQYIAASNVPKIKLAIGIKNNSSKSLGAYFLEEGEDPDTKATAASIARDKYLSGTTDNGANSIPGVVYATFSPYTEIPPIDGETYIYCELELKVLNRKVIDVTLDFDLNIEEYDPPEEEGV